MDTSSWALVSAFLTVVGAVAALMVFEGPRDWILTRWRLLKQQLVAIYHEGRGPRIVRLQVTDGVGLSASVKIGRGLPALDTTKPLQEQLQDLLRTIQDVEDRAREREDQLLASAELAGAQQLKRYERERAAELREAWPYERAALAFLAVASVIDIFIAMWELGGRH